jgi:hypothetical protein
VIVEATMYAVIGSLGREERFEYVRIHVRSISRSLWFF